MRVETHLQQAERHVAENAERIAKQKALIADLRKDGHEEAAVTGECLLKNLEDAQRLALAHLEVERMEASDKK